MTKKVQVLPFDSHLSFKSTFKIRTMTKKPSQFLRWLNLFKDYPLKNPGLEFCNFSQSIQINQTNVFSACINDSLIFQIRNCF